MGVGMGGGPLSGVGGRGRRLRGRGGGGVLGEVDWGGVEGDRSSSSGGQGASHPVL